MSSATAAARLDRRLLEPVFLRLEERVTAGQVPAAGLAVGDAEGLIVGEVFSPGRRRLDRDSLFYLASLSKPIFATAVMQLVEDGALDLHAPLASHLPELATPDKEHLSLWHLLTHTSGVPDILPEQIRRERPSAARMIERSLSAPLRFKPGSRWEYCGSSSYYILGELVRRVTGMSYQQYLDEQLFGPLGMNTTFDPRRKGRPVVSVKGVGADNRLTRYLLLRYVVSIAPPGGGLFASLDDLIAFGAALLRPRNGERGFVPLAPETVELMAADQTHGLRGVEEGVERSMHFGLGWNKPTLMSDVPGSPRVIAHGGATGASLWIDPDAALVFVYLTNQWDPDKNPHLEALSGVYEAFGKLRRDAAAS
jgi:serine-type D-Ala-D-Ala carboxypeptidase